MTRQKKIGLVIGQVLPKTIKVRVVTKRAHPLYLKPVRRTKHFLVHDEEKAAKSGDLVEIEESRPYSARKCFRLARIVQKTELTPEERALLEEEAMREAGGVKREVEEQVNRNKQNDQSNE